MCFFTKPASCFLIKGFPYTKFPPPAGQPGPLGVSLRTCDGPIKDPPCLSSPGFLLRHSEGQTQLVSGARFWTRMLRGSVGGDLSPARGRCWFLGGGAAEAERPRYTWPQRDDACVCSM